MSELEWADEPDYRLTLTVRGRDYRFDLDSLDAVTDILNNFTPRRNQTLVDVHVERVYALNSWTRS